MTTPARDETIGEDQVVEERQARFRCNRCGGSMSQFDIQGEGLPPLCPRCLVTVVLV